MANANSVYVTVLSDDSMEYFTLNTPSAFTNILSKEFNFEDGFEVGLVSISIQLDNVPHKDDLIISDTDKIKLKVPQVSIDSIQLDGFKNDSLPVEQFINMLNGRVSIFNKVIFTINYSESGIQYANMKVNVDDGFVVLDPHLSSILGFKKLKFEPGEHKAKSAINTELLINSRQSVSVQYIKYEEKLISIRKPLDNSLDSLCEALHLSFEDAGEEVFVALDNNETHINFDTKKEHLEFTLPYSISRYFEEEKNAVYSNGSSIQVNTYTEEDSREHILCCNSLIESQPYGQKLFPILRIIDLNTIGIKGNISQIFDPVQYCPLMWQRFKSISTTLLIFSSNYKISDKPATLVFHIRKKE